MLGRTLQKALWLLLLGAMVVGGVEAAAETIGPATITLHLNRYYEHWGRDGLTMLGYKVKSESRFAIDAWVLGLDECFDMEDIIWWSAFEWVEDPIRGLRFSPWTKTEFFYFYVSGPIEVGPVSVAVIDGGRVYYGTCDGPTCGEASISMSIVSGADVTFPMVTGAGEYVALQETVLRVSSPSTGWMVDHEVSVSAPQGADEQTILDIFQLALERDGGRAGTHEIGVSYALDIEAEDFNGLPQGSYVIGITYTLTADL